MAATLEHACSAAVWGPESSSGAVHSEQIPQADEAIDLEGLRAAGNEYAKSRARYSEIANGLTHIMSLMEELLCNVLPKDVNGRTIPNLRVPHHRAKHEPWFQEAYVMAHTKTLFREVLGEKLSKEKLREIWALCK
eukprot:g4633.t1